MQTEFLYEFVVFSKYLNFTKAAAELHMSQSNLSKHLRQLESEIGFPLVSNTNRKTRLTQEGNMFLGELVPMLNNLESLIERCANAYKDEASGVIVQEPPFMDKAGMAIYSAVNAVKADYPGINIAFSQVHKKDVLSAVESGAIGLAVVYSVDGSIDGGDVVGKPFMRSPAYVWLDSGHPLAKKETILVDDLRNIPIMQPSDAYSPVRQAITSMCLARGFKPQFRMVSYTFKIEYLFASPAEAVYIVPDVVDFDMTMRSRAQMTYRRIEDVEFDVLLLARKDNAGLGLRKVVDRLSEETAC